MQPLIADLDAERLPPAQALALVRAACELSIARPAGQGLDLGRLRADLDAAVATPALAKTVRYLAPELIDDGARPNPAADAYALGVLLFELLTGESPGHERATQIVPELDPRLDRLCAGLLAPHARRAPRSPAGLRAAIDALGPLRPQLGLRPPPRPIPAGLGHRALAGLLDLVPFGLLALAHLPAALALFVVVDLLVGSLGGTSPGKRLLGLELVGPGHETPNGPLGRRRALLRWATWLTCGVGYLFLLEPDGEALHDAAAGTSVVHAPRLDHLLDPPGAPS